MPTPSPGLKRVPRWRTMISPPVTAWPANTLTPRRLALESRPLREEPRPFLCAIGRFLRRSRWSGIGLGRGGDRFGLRLLRRALARRGGLDRRHLDPRQLLSVAVAALVAALGLELDDPQLRPALVGD